MRHSVVLILAGDEEIKFNLPEVAISKARDGDIPSGSFGPADTANHNVYECYVCPLVMANRVLNSRRTPGDPEIPPLPDALIPAGSSPTLNLVGHGSPHVISYEARARIEGFDFPDGDTVAARLKICPELMSRVNTMLFELRDRYKITNIGRGSLNKRNYIVPKALPGDIQFVKAMEDVPDDDSV